ncbi:hypothetical protein FHS97_000938 [Sphingomonas endophytica]|uniref:Uncharacterized protein n=1 Tax=Sphingomonas endophytica TaxID=869719 RepID=A0ABR6N2M3_9SPHN|nr:hypothetical protein [Sphingomonas endophytica]MBB5725030.1 hypothetical protein [Sphingomonas endophytica]
MAEALRNTPAQALRDAGYLDRAAEMLDAFVAPPRAPEKVERDDDKPAAWAVAAERAAQEAYAQHMGDPDGKDDCRTASGAAARTIERHAIAALSPQGLDAVTVERCAQMAEGFNDPNRDWLNRSVWDNIKRDTAARIRALLTKPRQQSAGSGTRSDA